MKLRGMTVTIIAVVVAIVTTVVVLDMSDEREEVRQSVLEVTSALGWPQTGEIAMLPLRWGRFCVLAPSPDQPCPAAFVQVEAPASVTAPVEVMSAVLAGLGWEQTSGPCAAIGLQSGGLGCLYEGRRGGQRLVATGIAPLVTFEVWAER